MARITSRKQIEISADFLAWFEEEFPDISLSSIVNGLLNEFMAIHVDTGVTPRKVMVDVAKEVKEKVEEGVSF